MHDPLPQQMTISERGRRLYSIPELTDTELDELLDIIYEAEIGGDITQVRCELPRTQRRALISSERERLVLLALFKLRYAKNIRDVIRYELSNITSVSARELYTQIAVMESLGSPLSRNLLADVRAGDERALLWLRTVVRVDSSGFLRLAHQLLVNPTVDVLAPEPDSRPDLLAGTLARLAGRGSGTQDTLMRYFLSEGISKRVFMFFRYELDRVRQFVDDLKDHLEVFNKAGLGAVAHCHLGTLEKDVLQEFGQATYEFEDALAVDPDSVYAATQLALAQTRQLCQSRGHGASGH
jgi:hypothetical protein